MKIDLDKLEKFIKNNYQTDGDEWGRQWLYHGWTLASEIEREFELYEGFNDEFSSKYHSMSLPPINQEKYIAEKIVWILQEREINHED